MAAKPDHPAPPYLSARWEDDLPATISPRPAYEMRAGDMCPACGKGRLDYDGLLNLACAECGYSLSGCFT